VGFFGSVARGSAFDFNQNIQKNVIIEILYLDEKDILQHFKFVKTGFVNPFWCHEHIIHMQIHLFVYVSS
jgi:hypothetical protein